MSRSNLNFADVANASDNFLKIYHPSLRLPVPIEEIVEQKMNISLYAVPDIKFLLGIDAFISSDFTQITVDKNCFTRYPDWYEKYDPKSLEDFLDSHDRMDNQIYKYIEIQAQTFAGLVLVPKDLLFKLNKYSYHS